MRKIPDCGMGGRWGKMGERGKKGGDIMIKFGTGVWRAIIADGFTKENIRLLTA